MSNDYGLSVTNANGGIMFDSRRQMDSYVVSSYGNGNGVVGTITDMVFVKGDASVSNELVACDRTFNQDGTVAYVFKTYDPATKTLADVALDYIHVRPSGLITPATGEDYGLQVRSPDGSVQFDSRSIKTDAHYLVTKIWRRLELYGNGLGSALTTDSAEYIEIARTTGVSVSIGESVSAIKFTGTNGNIPIYHDYIVTGIFTPITSYRYNKTSMFIAELDV
jgi:hypothetical protein